MSKYPSHAGIGDEKLSNNLRFRHRHSTTAAATSIPPPTTPATTPTIAQSNPVTSVAAATVEMTETSPTTMPAELSAELRLSVVMRPATASACSAETITLVSTTTDVRSSFRLRPVLCSTTESIETPVSATLSAVATPEMYAALTASATNSARLICTLVENVIVERAATQSPTAVLPETVSGFSSGHDEHCAAPTESLYVPVGHAVQVSPPAMSPEKPGAQPQPLAAVLPSADAVFAPQLVQALELTPLANEPEGHTAHAALPVASLYVPAPHPVQGPPLAPVYPKEQMHAVTATLPVTDTLEPDGHVEQSAVSAVAAYVPTGHLGGVQLPPLAASPVNPAGHSQLMPPAADTALTGQVVHIAEPMAPLYVPTGHAAQLPSLASASPVKPAAHAQLVVYEPPSATTTSMVEPAEQPQNTTAGRWSPISAR